MRGGTRLRSSRVEHPPLKRTVRVRVPPEVLIRGCRPAAGRRPPKSETRVRIPSPASFHGSSMAEQAAVNRKIGGSSPSRGATRGVAQSGRERVLGVHEVVGSNHATPTPFQPFHLGVAQLGRARGSGPRGCRFKSCHPDICLTQHFNSCLRSSGEQSARFRTVRPQVRFLPGAQLRCGVGPAVPPGLIRLGRRVRLPAPQLLSHAVLA